MPLTVSPIKLANQRTDAGELFPLALQCDSSGTAFDDVAAWISTHRDELDEQLALHGAILFRGFPLATPDDFDAFIRLFNYPNFRYADSLSNAVRKVATERVFSANEAPPEVTIFLHHEMAQTPIYPSRLFFFCEIAAESGGATPLCRSDVLFEQIERELPHFAHDCAEKGLKYTNIMPGTDDAGSGMGRSWQSTFRADRRDVVEQRLTELNYSWEWLDDGCLKATTPPLPAVRRLKNGRKSFFNQLIAASRGWKDSRNDPANSLRHGDDSPLDQSAVLKTAELAEALTFDLAWQVGDVALVDNFSTMHARRSFVGTRKVWASLVAAE